MTQPTIEKNSDSDQPRSEPILAVKELTKRFGDNVVLNRINLSIEKGKTTVVLGPSGCGKTVLIKHLIVLMRPTSGVVYFNSRRIDHLDDRELYGIRTNFGFLFQGGALFDSMTVSENILFPIRQHKETKRFEDLSRTVRTKLAMVGMEGYEDYYPAALSGGQRKRVALARAIAMNPQVVLYDEPTTGLDPIRSDVINELILKLQRELGVTSVVVTHDINSAYKVGDRIIMLHKGNIIADGNPKHIRNTCNSVVQQFLRGEASEEDLAVLREDASI